MPSSFRELIVWQRAIQMTKVVYRYTEQFPKSETFGLTSQLRRSAVSIASNIAEGYGRGTKGEFIHFLGIARGSNCELQTQLVIARELNFGDQAYCQMAEDLSHEVGKMITAIIRRCKSGK